MFEIFDSDWLCDEVASITTYLPGTNLFGGIRPSPPTCKFPKSSRTMILIYLNYLHNVLFMGDLINVPFLRLQNSRDFFGKITQEIGKAWRKSLTRAKRVRREKKSLSPVSLSVFILVPDLLLDCSRLLEYAKIRTFLQSSLSIVLNRLQMEELVNAVEQEVIITNILEPRYNDRTSK